MASGRKLRLERSLAIQLDDALVALIARHVEQDLGEVLVVLDHQHRTVAFFDPLAIIIDYRLRHRPTFRLILQSVTGRPPPLIATHRSPQSAGTPASASVSSSSSSSSTSSTNGTSSTPSSFPSIPGFLARRR
jgi:hypothetical protein